MSSNNALNISSEEPEDEPVENRLIRVSERLDRAVDELQVLLDRLNQRIENTGPHAPVQTTAEEPPRDPSKGS